MIRLGPVISHETLLFWFFLIVGLQKTPQISITHVSGDLLLRRSRDKFCFTMQCLQAHVRMRSATTMKMRPFQKFRKYFFDCASKVYDAGSDLEDSLRDKTSVQKVKGTTLKIGDSEESVQGHQYIISRL